MMPKFGRIAVVSAAVLALAAPTIPSRAEADGYYRVAMVPSGTDIGAAAITRAGAAADAKPCPASSAALLPGLCSAALLWLRWRL